MYIALVEDVKEQAEVTQLYLEQGGHRVSWYETGAELLKALPDEAFELIILDWDLEGMQGDEVLVEARRQLTNAVPIMFVTIHDEEQDVVRILKMGADDYIIKPIKIAEFLARIEALGRRYKQSAKIQQTEYPPYTLDLSNRKIFVSGTEVPTTQKEFELIAFLFRNAGRLLSRGEILESVWGHSTEIPTRTIDTHISRIRKKLEFSSETGWRIAVVYQYGYRLERLDGPTNANSDDPAPNNQPFV